MKYALLKPLPYFTVWFLTYNLYKEFCTRKGNDGCANNSASNTGVKLALFIYIMYRYSTAILRKHTRFVLLSCYVSHNILKPRAYGITEVYTRINFYKCQCCRFYVLWRKYVGHSQKLSNFEDREIDTFRHTVYSNP